MIRPFVWSALLLALAGGAPAAASAESRAEASIEFSTQPGAGVTLDDPALNSAISGAWRLDAQRSDDASDALADALGDIAKDLRPPARARANPSGLSRAPPRSALARDLFGPVRLAQSELLIELDAAWVRFARDGAPAEQIFTDRRSSIVDAENRGVRLGSWEDQVLWIERSSDRGTRVIESWRMDGATLVADYEVRNGLLEEPVRFTLVFARPTDGRTDP